MVGDNQLIGRTRLRVGREDGFSIRFFQWQILEETVRGEGLEEVAVISYGTAIDGFLRKVVTMIVRDLSCELLHVCGSLVAFAGTKCHDTLQFRPQYLCQRLFVRKEGLGYFVGTLGISLANSVYQLVAMCHDIVEHICHASCVDSNNLVDVTV